MIPVVVVRPYSLRLLWKFVHRCVSCVVVVVVLFLFGNCSDSFYPNPIPRIATAFQVPLIPTIQQQHRTGNNNNNNNNNNFPLVMRNKRKSSRLSYSNANDLIITTATTTTTTEQPSSSSPQMHLNDTRMMIPNSIPTTTTTAPPPPPPQQQQRRRTKPASTTTITTLHDFYTVIQECRAQNTLLIVHWSAPWCRSCQRIAPLLQRTMHQLSQSVGQQQQQQQDESDQQQQLLCSIRYINIPLLYSLSTTLHQDNIHAMMDITTVPYCHVYHPHLGLIHEFTLSPNNNNIADTTTTAASSAPMNRRRRRQPTKATATGSNNHHQPPTKTIGELHTLVASYLQCVVPTTNDND